MKARRIFPFAVLLVIFSLVLAACAPAAVEEPTPEPTSTPRPQPTPEPTAEPLPSIAEIAAGDENFSTLVAALSAAGLVETFAGEGEFTVFAPTNAAFEAAFAALGLTPEELLANAELLTSVLQYHVVPGVVTSDQVASLESATTLLGEDVAIRVEMGTVYINDASVITADIEASNGIIHVIDAVLLPESVLAALQPPSIAEIAAGDENFSTLVAALSAAGLVETFAGEGEFTVFAPTNAAFEAAFAALGISAEDLLADTELLTSILTYHVVEGKLMAADVLEQNLLFTLNGAPALVYASDEGAFIQGAPISATDIEASNGVIHVIDAVILPPAYETEATADIVDTAVENGSFTVLAAALEATGLLEAMKTRGPWTVFAPTDAAFEALLSDLGVTAEELLAREDLAEILLYHVTVGAYRSADVVAAEALWMANGQPAAIDAEALTIAGVALNAGLLDIETSNGIIHVIDYVMLPPAE